MLIDRSISVAEQVMCANIPLLSRLSSERKRFEDWLQLEMLKILMQEYPRIEIEKGFPSSHERCDFWLMEHNGPQSWVELKLCVTNYCSQYCETSSARPITNQISDIERDLVKLQRLPEAHARNVLLIVYPFPDSDEVQPQWLSHLARLKATAGEVSEAFTVRLEHNAKFAKAVAYSLSPKHAEA